MCRHGRQAPARQDANEGPGLDGGPRNRPVDQREQMGGLTTHVCLVPPALSARAEGFNVCSVQDCAAATQNTLLSAHAKGLAAVWTTVFPANADAVRALLSIPPTVVPFACVPLGRPAGSVPQTGSRFDESKVHRQAWGGC